MQNNPSATTRSLQFQDIATLATILMGVIVVAALYLARDILIPIALAVLVSFVLAPMALALRRTGLPRVPAVIAVVAISFGVILGIGALGTTQLSQLAEKLPEYQSNINNKIRSLRGSTASDGTVSKATTVLKEIGREISGANQPQAVPSTTRVEPSEQAPMPVEIRPGATNPLKVAIEFLQPLLGPLASTGLVILFVIFILLQREDLRDRMIKLLGTKEIHRTTEVMDEAAARLSRYFLLQTALNAGFGVVVGVALWIIGVPSPLLWGIFTMLMRFVPYIGSILAAVLPVALAAAVDPGWTMVGWTIALFLIGEPVMGHVVEPLVFGKHTGLSPVAIVAAATFWTWLWGPIGLIVATPLTLCLVILGQYTKRLEFLHVLLGDQPALTPPESFYQRLIAGDPAEIIEQAEAQLKQCQLTEYYETVALPGLALAQRDMSSGELPPERQALLVDGIMELIDGLSDHEDVPCEPQTVAMEVADNASPPLYGHQLSVGTSNGTLQVAVLCLGGRGAVDHAAAALLAQLLGRNGIGAELARDQGSQGLAAMQAELGQVPLVCVCYVATARPVQVRLMMRRIRRMFPAAKVVVGLWRMPYDTSALQEIESAAGGDLFASTLTEALAVCTAALKAPVDQALVQSENQDLAQNITNKAVSGSNEADPTGQLLVPRRRNVDA